MSESSQTLPIDTVLDGRYRLISESPQDLGIRYLAQDLRQDRPVVVLELSPRWGGGTEALQRVQEAQRAVAGLGAPNLLPYEHVGIVDVMEPEMPVLYLVRAQPDAQTLADLLSLTGRLDVKSAVEITTRLCEALAPAHHAGLVHGSLSPTSVLLTSLESPTEPLRQTVTVVDVGLVPALRPRGLPPGRPWGRTPYLSPEQAAGEEIHPAVDVYVIGSLLYEMLTGRPPFRASDEMVLALQHLRQEPPSLQILAPDTPPALVQIVHKALAKEPAARYRNAGQLAHILKSQVGLASSPEQPMSSARTLERTDDVRILTDQVPARQRLVVPPPPAQSPSMAPVRTPSHVPWEIADVTGPYDLAKAGDSAKKSTGVDWLMIGLAIVALIAVLGLIPLWRTVYKRYVAPPPASAPALYSTAVSLPDAVSPPDVVSPPEATHLPWGLSGEQTARFHVSAGRYLAAGVGNRSPVCTFGSPAYGSGSTNAVNCRFSI